MSGDLGGRKTSTIRGETSAKTSSSSMNSRQQESKNASSKDKKTMEKNIAGDQYQKPDFQTLINLVHSSDIQACTESATALREMILNGDSGLLIGLLSQYVQNPNSENLLDIIAAVRHPIDKVLLDQLTDIWRVHPHACLKLVSHLILKQVPWLLKFPQHASFGQFLKSMRSSSDDVTYCIGVALLLASLVLLTAPLISPNLPEIFNAFLFLAGVLHKKTPSSAAEETPFIRISLLHFRLALYALFQRLYGLFPCHFLTFLRQNFAGPQTTAENRVLYQEIIRPMLDVVKLHPLLVTANKESELAKERWVRKEIHDIMAECNRVAGDPFENCIQEDSTSSQYFQRGIHRPSSPGSNILTWNNSFASRPTSSIALLSGKPTPVKNGSTAVTPKKPSGFSGPNDFGEKRPQFLAPIFLPSGPGPSSIGNIQKSASGSQQISSPWSPSDAVGLSTPPDDEENVDEEKVAIPEMRKKHYSERSGVLRKTSMAAGPETPAPHMRSFRTGSWGAEARQKFLQNRQQNQENQADRKSSMSRRSFGQAWAKIFNRPGTSSVPQSPSVQQEGSFDFDFGPTEYRPASNSMVRQYRESQLSQQPELAEEADEACASSLASSKRPSLSEPSLCQDQQESKQSMEEGVNLKKLSVISNSLSKENDENLLEDAELQRYWASAARYTSQNYTKRQSFSSSRTSSSAAIVNVSGDRTRHSSSATATVLQGDLSRHSSLLDTQAVAGSSISITPTGHKNTTTENGNSRDATGFTLGAPDDNEEDEEMSRLRTSTDSGTEDGGVPRLSTSQSVADFIIRINRMRFDSRCAVGEETRDENPSDQDRDRDVDQSTPKMMEKSPQPMPVEISRIPAIQAEFFRRRGSTFSGVISRPLSCPPNAQVINAQIGRKRQGNGIDRSILSDDVVEKETASEEARVYDALLLLTHGQIVAPPSIPVRPSPYQLLDDYMAKSYVSYSDDHSWQADTKDDGSGTSSMEKANQSPDLHAQRKTSGIQKKMSTLQPHSSNRDPKDVQALKSEIQTLQAELAIWKERVRYERVQRLLHADRNRRLYGRLKQATALDEQNQAQRDQIRLQENEIAQLTAALSELRRQNANQRQEYTNKEFRLTSRLQAVQRENETTKSSLVASKRGGDELLQENIRLKKELGSFVQKLFDKEAAYAQLHEQCAQDLPTTKQNIAQLNKELFLMGESNGQLRQRNKAMKLRQEEFESLRERLRMSEETSKQESNAFRRQARKERHKSEAATQRVQELEALMLKRQAQIVESKRRLDQASDVHLEQMAATKMKYTALMTVCQRQESHILELYEKLEAKTVEDRRKSGVGIRSVEQGGFGGFSGDNHSNGGNTVEDIEDSVGLDIPMRTGAASEIRSYDSYHSASYIGQHAIMSASVASGSSDLYLPFLFHAAQQQQDNGDGDGDKDIENVV